jgi:5'(3')-deoxyribonucleotidase
MNQDSKPRIGVDVDDTATDLVKYWLDYFNYKTGLNIKKEDIHSWDISNYVPEEYRKYLFEILSENELWEMIQPLPESQYYLKLLSEEYNLYLITATHWTNATAKGNMLNRHFPFIDLHKKLIIASDKKMIKVKLLVDDNKDNLVGGIYQKVLFTQPWNEKYNLENKRMARAKNWAEAYEKIHEILPTNRKDYI